MTGQVQVRQWALKDDSGAIVDSLLAFTRVTSRAGRPCTGDRGSFDGTRDRHELFFPIPAREVQFLMLAGRSDQHREPRDQIGLSLLVNSREQLVEALTETRREQRLSGDDIHLLETG